MPSTPTTANARRHKNSGSPGTCSAPRSPVRTPPRLPPAVSFGILKALAEQNLPGSAEATENSTAAPRLPTDTGFDASNSFDSSALITTGRDGPSVMLPPVLSAQCDPVVKKAEINSKELFGPAYPALLLGEPEPSLAKTVDDHGSVTVANRRLSAPRSLSDSTIPDSPASQLEAAGTAEYQSKSRDLGDSDTEGAEFFDGEDTRRCTELFSDSSGKMDPLRSPPTPHTVKLKTPALINNANDIQSSPDRTLAGSSSSNTSLVTNILNKAAMPLSSIGDPPKSLTVKVSAVTAGRQTSGAAEVGESTTEATRTATDEGAPAVLVLTKDVPAPPPRTPLVDKSGKRGKRGRGVDLGPPDFDESAAKKCKLNDSDTNASSELLPNRDDIEEEEDHFGTEQEETGDEVTGDDWLSNVHVSVSAAIDQAMKDIRGLKPLKQRLAGCEKADDELDQRLGRKKLRERARVQDVSFGTLMGYVLIMSAPRLSQCSSQLLRCG